MTCLFFFQCVMYSYQIVLCLLSNIYYFEIRIDEKLLTMPFKPRIASTFCSMTCMNFHLQLNSTKGILKKPSIWHVQPFPPWFRATTGNPQLATRSLMTVQFYKILRRVVVNYYATFPIVTWLYFNWLTFMTYGSTLQSPDCDLQIFLLVSGKNARSGEWVHTYNCMIHNDCC